MPTPPITAYLYTPLTLHPYPRTPTYTLRPYPRTPTCTFAHIHAHRHTAFALHPAPCIVHATLSPALTHTAHGCVVRCEQVGGKSTAQQEPSSALKSVFLPQRAPTLRSSSTVVFGVERTYANRSLYPVSCICLACCCWFVHRTVCACTAVMPAFILGLLLRSVLLNEFGIRVVLCHPCV